MVSIREELQEWEDQYEDGYKLKTNEEIINKIKYFGNGETNFHTVDINRLVVENDRVKRLIQVFQSNANNNNNNNSEVKEVFEGVVKELNKIF